ncbi:hypothetical protein R4Z10_13050 [Niallia sp. XMNu-256]|uniref:hypothetical protein n=1 Tax=Niallia sp. XMNu-256 TaxID=3082444 RepID=UPI0030D2CD5A
MTKENIETPKVKNFEVEELVSHHPVHRRHEFSFTVDGDEYKGHFHEGEITWMHPYPNQTLSEEKVNKIENEVHKLLGQQGISSGIKKMEMMQVFKDRPHERRQVILKIDEDEYKGFVHNGEIQWFHPHPKQKLNDEHVEVIETEIHERGFNPS